ncbi:hypothetical protein ACYF6T_20940 [Streptomyces sp. 7R007]
MHRIRTTAAGAAMLAALSACGSQAGPTAPHAGAPAAPSAPLTAQTAFRQLSRTVTTATLTGTVTAGSDPDHLLGRPDEYTSKVTFSDSFVPADEVTGAAPGDVERGGAIEVFANASDAKARAAYVAGVTESQPALAEYDYVHGTVLVRVSRLLPPDRAATYKTATAHLPAP